MSDEQEPLYTGEPDKPNPEDESDSSTFWGELLDGLDNEPIPLPFAEFNWQQLQVIENKFKSAKSDARLMASLGVSPNQTTPPKLSHFVEGLLEEKGQQFSILIPAVVLSSEQLGDNNAQARALILNFQQNILLQDILDLPSIPSVNMVDKHITCTVSPPEDRRSSKATLKYSMDLSRRLDLPVLITPQLAKDLFPNDDIPDQFSVRLTEIGTRPEDIRGINWKL